MYRTLIKDYDLQIAPTTLGVRVFGESDVLASQTQNIFGVVTTETPEGEQHSFIALMQARNLADPEDAINAKEQIISWYEECCREEYCDMMEFMEMLYLRGLLDGRNEKA